MRDILISRVHYSVLNSSLRSKRVFLLLFFNFVASNYSSTSIGYAYARIPMHTEVLPRIAIQTAKYTRANIVLEQTPILMNLENI